MEVGARGVLRRAAVARSITGRRGSSRECPGADNWTGIHMADQHERGGGGDLQRRPARRGDRRRGAVNGYLCDPASKSPLRILARRGIKVRLTRNFDKQRGFVNGATGTVCESLRDNAVFIVKLYGTGNLVLVYPMEEDGMLFLPCCYGFATTIRRAQGASLSSGCIWFNQKRHAAGT